MHQIDDVECFSNCTQLCKPHESNKAVWQISEAYNNATAEEKQKLKTDLLNKQEDARKNIGHPDFI